MDLHIQWRKATKQEPIKSQVEETFRESLLETFGTPERAFDCKAEFKRLGEPPGHPWVVGYCKAHRMAVAILSPHEQRAANIAVNFILEE